MNNEDNHNDCHSNFTNNDGTTSTTDSNLSLLCCVCQDRASGRHYGVLSCEVIKILSSLLNFYNYFYLGM